MQKYMLFLILIATFSACSIFKPNQNNTMNLHTKWALASIDETAYSADELGRYLPTLTIDSAGERVSGNAGCNRYNGQVTIEDDRLVFGPFMSTKMACPQLELEQKFMRLLSEKTVQHHIQDDQLVLISGDIRLTFKSIE